MESNHQKSDPYVIFAAFGNLQEYENLHFPSTFAILSLIRIRSGHFLAQKPFPCHRFWDLPVWLALRGIGFCLYFCNFELDPDSIWSVFGTQMKCFLCQRMTRSNPDQTQNCKSTGKMQVFILLQISKSSKNNVRIRFLMIELHVV